MRTNKTSGLPLIFFFTFLCLFLTTVYSVYASVYVLVSFSVSFAYKHLIFKGVIILIKHSLLS